jgi:hypothetical protein
VKNEVNKINDSPLISSASSCQYLFNITYTTISSNLLQYNILFNNPVALIYKCINISINSYFILPKSIVS